MVNWNNKAKNLLKSELVRRGISNSDLAKMFSSVGIKETKSSIDSKISRGTFSASFFIQCLMLIGCKKIEIEEFDRQVLIHSESKPEPEYTINKG